MLCVSIESMYACELSFNTMSVTQSNIHGCQRILNVGTTGYIMSLSNTVVYHQCDMETSLVSTARCSVQVLSSVQNHLKNAQFLSYLLFGK